MSVRENGSIRVTKGLELQRRISWEEKTMCKNTLNILENSNNCLITSGSRSRHELTKLLNNIE